MSNDEVHASGRRLLVGDVSDVGATAFALPTGIVTFLLTDVEGSSRRWETAPDAMAAAIPRHYGVLDEAIASHGGVRPVEQGEGDSVVGAFSRPSDAIAAALDAQRALAAESWPEGAQLAVRMAIHTGEAQLRDEGNYFGQTVIRCARLRAIGHGGQVLISDSTAGLVADRLPEGAELLALGVHRLKDLSRPERVWQLGAADLRVDFPALLSLDAFRHNLPVQLTPLIGRGPEVADVSRLVSTERLVTLTGSGGIGKTRLSLAVAAELVDRYPGGAWFVELAGVDDAVGIASAALGALGSQQAPGADLTLQLATQLGREGSLLVLDNCEHLLDGCARLAAAVLAANPAVTMLTTSREPLGVPGEISWRVPSLAVPPLEIGLAVPALSQYDAVRLFIERARRARPSFAISDANAPAVAQLCSRLDGIPLAIELAAARCRQLSAERIAAELDDRFRLLIGGGRTLLPRQQTLAASIDWSHDRLDPSEQVTFRRLSVFSGAFPLEAAEVVVASGGEVGDVEVFDVLTRLADKSLVSVEDGPLGDPRYLLLESLRAYGLNRLEAAGELEATQVAHIDWCLQWLEQHAGMLHHDAVLEEADALHDNLRAALDHSVDRPFLGLRLLNHVARAWQVSGRAAEAMAPIALLLTDENAERYGPGWATAAVPAGALVMLVGGHAEATALHRKAEQLAVELDLPYEAAIARWHARGSADDCARARDLARERGDEHYYRYAHFSWIAEQINSDPQTGAPFLDAEELTNACRTSTWVREYTSALRVVAFTALGDLRRSIELGIGLTNSKSPFILWSAVNRLSHAALYARDEQGLVLAAATAEEKMPRGADDDASTDEAGRHCLALFDGSETSVVNPYIRDQFEWLFVTTLHFLSKEALDAEADALAIHAVRNQWVDGPYPRAVQAAIEAAAADDEDRWHDALSLASAHGLRLIVVDALEGLAAAASRAESWAECLRLFGAAQRLRDETEFRWRFPSEQQAIDDAVASARAELGDSDADAAEADGRSLEWPDAARYASRARGERKRPRHGWDSLTPTEEQVIAAIVDGLTNPQIAQRLLMSRSTVKTHLEHIFAKLGVTSRAELAAQAARRQR